MEILEDSRKLFSQGYYGKPIGIPKPKIEPYKGKGIKDLIEGLYLLENKKITITKLKEKITSEQLEETAFSPRNFENKYRV